MNSRKIQERTEFKNGIRGEWEPTTSIEQKNMTDKEILAWVRMANKEARLNDEYVRYRSVDDDSGVNW